MRVTRRRILCVEDNEDHSFLLATLLGRANYDVVSARDGADALRLAGERKFDLIVLDRRLAGGGGGVVELCRRIRESDPHTPVLFYTGDDYERARRESLAAGAQAYVVKPGFGELLEAVGRLLGTDMTAAAAGTVHRAGEPEVGETVDRGRG